MTVRIATFNAENLMARFDFSGRRDDLAMVTNKKQSSNQYKQSQQARVVAHEDDARQMTALAIADCGADIICFQEVENLATLEAFERNYLYRMTGLEYPNKVWIEGNDSRGIDVALMAREQTADGRKISVERIKSHRKSTFGELGVHTDSLQKMGFDADERIFRRDCLEVDLRIGGKWLTLFISHFKSMGSSRNGVPGRDYTMPVRLAEARAVRKIVERKFGSERTPQMRWIICGDLNDYNERLVVTGNQSKGYEFQLEAEAISGVEPLIVDGFSHDLIKRRAPDNRWTFYYAGGPVADPCDPETRETRHLVQLDYLLASPALALANETVVPDIIRAGQPYRTVFPHHQDVERYPRTGWDRPKASDHCPVAVTLNMV